MTEENASNIRTVFRKSLLGMVFAAILFIVLLPILIVIGIIYIVWTAILYIAIWITWSPRGRFVLFVYSDSPIWKSYLEQEVFPHIEKRAIFLNWSERKHWNKSLAVFVFNRYGDVRNFNPLAIVFHPFRIQKSFRFLEAFKDFKHGNTDSVERLTREFFAYLNA